jgi:hypothetical protein
MPAPPGAQTRHRRGANLGVCSDLVQTTRPNTIEAELSGADFRELAGLADIRDQRRANNLEALLRGPTIGAFAPGAPPLPPTSREELMSAMSALALRGFSIAGLLRSAEGFAAGRLPPEVLDGVVAAVAARGDRGQL